MARSGVYTSAPNRDQIIRRAARLVNAVASGETPDPQTTQDFAEALNAMVKLWQATGIHVWSEQELVLFPQPNQVRYQIGPTSPDNVTASYSMTTLPSGAAAAATSVVVTSASSIQNGDNIGIVMTTGFIFWTTVNGAPVGTTVNLASGLTSAAAAGANVFNYTTRSQRPLRVISSRRYNIASQIDTPMDPALSRLDYRALPNKLNTGTFTQYFHDPKLDNTHYHIWPAPPDVTNLVKMTTMYPLQIYTVAGDTSDFPDEWVNPLVFNLALSMSPEYSIPDEQYNRIEKLATMYFDTAQGFDKEPESIYFGVSFNQRG